MHEPTPIRRATLDTENLVENPREYLRQLLTLGEHALEELNAGLLANDAELTKRASRRLRSIGTLADVAAESL